MSKPLNKRQREAMQRDDGGFTAGLLRSHIIDVLGDVPRLALGATVALDFADDPLAYDMLAAIVAAVREAATSMNELQRETRKGAE
ncbi:MULTISPECIES: hypothetical protein [Methylosinus]|uniref:Uncharacterized protein n=1 Tax=Methylosinus trichosporium (strain ATCC 35070 / NCIMB 11131 / UNIQEM 75 / OB3b) TaxID=595536 RepID=A0A2D2CVS4_METT3|nr:MULTISPECIES: hypothetical protein [Methylosinus]ATQ66892.1 hypothetical protein CQW49_02510 [Methylosinus trichosporium OB3b]OBS54144.1 hypothetical protein A8B73_02630 [Methylosinus sp. 3S-1]